MKSLVLSTLMMSFAPMALAATPPKLTLMHRVQTDPSTGGDPVIVKDKSGRKILVQLQEVPGNNRIDRLVAIDENGKTVASEDVDKPGVGEGLLIARVDQNASGDIVVITQFGDTSHYHYSLYSDNLTKGTAALLADTGKFASFESRIQLNGRNLALVTADMDPGPNNTRPEEIRVVDEDTGAVIQETVVDNGVAGRLALDSHGNLKALLTGYELFGVLDVASGTFTNILPPRTQPSIFPNDLKLVTGTFIQFTDSQEVQLLSQADLVEGKLRPVAKFPVGTAFTGGDPARFAVEPLANGMLIVDLTTGKPAGPVIKVPNPGLGRAESMVEDIIETPSGVVALLSRLKVPNSFLPGTVLTYVKVATGEILRETSLDKESLTGQLIMLNGRLSSLEVQHHSLKPEHVDLIDIGTNKSIAGRDSKVLGPAFPSTSGRMVAASVMGDQTCVFNIQDSTGETCVQDPLVNSGAQYGYPLFATSPGDLQVPLLGQISGFRYPELGYAEFRVD